MIPLPKSVIDNIFEPRREIRTPKELEAAVGRLLWDGLDPKKDGRHHFFRLAKKREDGRTLYYWEHPSQRMVDAIGFREDKPAKGRYPAWVHEEVYTNDPWGVRPADTMYELLPEPIGQGEILEAFYRIALPNWDNMAQIDGWPRVSEPTWIYIVDKFREFDRRMFKGKNVMPGGCWALGSGFSAARKSEGATLPDWMIDNSECKVAYKDTPFHFTIHESIYGEQNEYHIFRARLIFENGIYDNIDNAEQYTRFATIEDAMAACAKRAGEPVIWEPLIGPLNSDGERVWCSHTVQLRKAA